MKKPLITVITPVYNCQRFIESCLQSVIDQNCPDVEHLIIDGGSSDMTLKIIEPYVKRYPHLRVISEKDRGQSNAMNHGIILARGGIIGILNSDDYYQPGIFHRVLKIFESLPTPSFLVGNCNVLNDDEKVIYINKPSKLSLTNILIGGEKNQFPFNPSSYFYHKSLHERIGPFDEFDHYTMDLDFILRAVCAAHVHYVDEIWGNFRFIRGTKTFQSKVNNLLESNKMRVMNVYLAQLPAIQRRWIKIVRFFCVERKHHYYMGRLTDCIRNPHEISLVLARKFRKDDHISHQNTTPVKIPVGLGV